MKKIIVLTLSVLCCTLVFANGTDDPSKMTSSVALLNLKGSNIVKVLYKAPRLGKVKISIINERDERIFRETIRGMDGFIRPYNFDGLPDGAYTIEIEDVFGKQVEKLNYHWGKIDNSGNTGKLIRLAKLPGTETKYLLTGLAQNEDDIQVRIYDEDSKLVFEENRRVLGEFGKIYDLKDLSGPFTIEVSDKAGVLKSIHN